MESTTIPYASYLQATITFGLWTSPSRHTRFTFAQFVKIVVSNHLHEVKEEGSLHFVTMLIQDVITH
jgi:hypothetical protein